MPKSAWVVWNDAPISGFINRMLGQYPFEYTVEINPPTEAPLKNFLYHDIPDYAGMPGNSNRTSLLSSKNGSLTSSMSDAEFGVSLASMYKYSTRFDGLEDSAEYTVSISTELNGKTITQITMKVNKHGSNSGSSPKADKDNPRKWIFAQNK